MATYLLGGVVEPPESIDGEKYKPLYWGVGGGGGEGPVYTVGQVIP